MRKAEVHVMSLRITRGSEARYIPKRRGVFVSMTLYVKEWGM